MSIRLVIVHICISKVEIYVIVNIHVIALSRSLSNIFKYLIIICESFYCFKTYLKYAIKMEQCELGALKFNTHQRKCILHIMTISLYDLLYVNQTLD